MNLEVLKKELKRTFKNIFWGLLMLAIFAPIYLWLVHKFTKDAEESVQSRIAAPKVRAGEGKPSAPSRPY